MFEEDYLLLDENSNVQTDFGTFMGDAKEIDTQSNEFKNIQWQRKNLQIYSSELEFLGDDSMPFEVSSLRTPCDFFSYFVTNELLTELANQTNLYARQGNPKTEFEVNLIDLKKYIGILVYMSVYEYPNVRSYWGRHAFSPIHTTMTVNRFEEIRQYLHFADNQNMPGTDHHDYDMLYKVRHIITYLNNRFLSIPMLQHVCVDEQMCATKMKGSKIRQFMPNKPHKWGFKLFVLCDSSGFSYAFEVYTGVIIDFNKLCSDFEYFYF